MTTESRQALLADTREAMHRECVVCGRSCAPGLGLDFVAQADGSVCAQFACPSGYEGYQGVLHGGVISSLLDGAMTNCLFAHGIAALTGELVVRFRHPVATGTPISVFGRIVRSTPPLHVMEAHVVQDGVIMAVAKGKFMEMQPQGGAP
ncbi:MAG: PaaI family thioesterase [Phycisphaerae bacterium]